MVFSFLKLILLNCLFCYHTQIAIEMPKKCDDLGITLIKYNVLLLKL